MVASRDGAQRVLDDQVRQPPEKAEAADWRRRIRALEESSERVMESGERGLRVGLGPPDPVEGRQERPPRANDGEGDGDIGHALRVHRVQGQVGPEEREGRPPAQTDGCRHPPPQRHRWPLSPWPRPGVTRVVDDRVLGDVPKRALTPRIHRLCLDPTRRGPSSPFRWSREQAPFSGRDPARAPHPWPRPRPRSRPSARWSPPSAWCPAPFRAPDP